MVTLKLLDVKTPKKLEEKIRKSIEFVKNQRAIDITIGITANHLYSCHQVII